MQPVQLGAAPQPDQASPAVVLQAPHVPAMQPAPLMHVPSAAHLGVGEGSGSHNPAQEDPAAEIARLRAALYAAQNTQPGQAAPAAPPVPRFSEAGAGGQQALPLVLPPPAVDEVARAYEVLRAHGYHVPGLAPPPLVAAPPAPLAGALPLPGAPPVAPPVPPGSQPGLGGQSALPSTAGAQPLLAGVGAGPCGYTLPPLPVGMEWVKKGLGDPFLQFVGKVEVQLEGNSGLLSGSLLLMLG